MQITIFLVIFDKILFMFKLDTLAFVAGLESDAATILGALQNIATITPPVTIAAIRSQLETGQTQAFDDNSFNQFLQRVHDLPLVYADLTTAEKTILNVIREEINPPSNFNICGGATYPIAAEFDLLFNDRVGSATFEKQVLGVSNVLVPCECAYITMDIAATGLGPSAIVGTFDLNKIGTVAGLLNFSYLWLDFVSDPTGFEYTSELVFKDSAGVTLDTIYKTNTF